MKRADRDQNRCNLSLYANFILYISHFHTHISILAVVLFSCNMHGNLALQRKMQHNENHHSSEILQIIQSST
jgi:hypothetical protein